MTSGSWVLANADSTPKPNARVLVVAFADAGATTAEIEATSARWNAVSGPSVFYVWPVLPGHAPRTSDTPCSAVPNLVSDLLRGLLSSANRPYVLYGHGFGAAVAYELAVAATAAGKPPILLAVAGRRAPHFPPIRRVSDLSPQDLVEKVAKMRNDDRMYTAFALAGFSGTEVLASEVAADERYLLDAMPSPPRLSCQILAVAGEDDRTVTDEQGCAWRKYTAARSLHFSRIRGPHDFTRGEAILVPEHAFAADFAGIVMAIATGQPPFLTLRMTPRVYSQKAEAKAAAAREKAIAAAKAAMEMREAEAAAAAAAAANGSEEKKPAATSFVRAEESALTKQKRRASMHEVPVEPMHRMAAKAQQRPHTSGPLQPHVTVHPQPAARAHHKKAKTKAKSKDDSPVHSGDSTRAVFGESTPESQALRKTRRMVAAIALAQKYAESGTLPPKVSKEKIERKSAAAAAASASASKQKPNLALKAISAKPNERTSPRSPHSPRPPTAPKSPRSPRSPLASAPLSPLAPRRIGSAAPSPSMAPDPAEKKPDSPTRSPLSIARKSASSPDLQAVVKHRKYELSCSFFCLLSISHNTTTAKQHQRSLCCTPNTRAARP